MSPEIGRRLRLLRREAGLSIRALAAAAGVSPTTLQSIETARRPGNFATLEALCDPLGLSVGDLVAGLPDVRDARARELWRRAA